MNLYLGCPIWSFKGWVGSFYPKGTKPGDYLREYSRRLTTIEGNTTFYAVPAQKTVQQWIAETPESFRFCPKLPRAISHAGKLMGHVEEALRFVEVMTPLGVRLGPMFLQLPPRYSASLFEDLRAFLETWPPQVRLAVEVRHLDWFESSDHERLNKLLAQHDMARVMIDTRPIRSLEGDEILKDSVYQTLLEARERKPNVPLLPGRTTNFVFMRYIGHPQMQLNTPFLSEWGSFLGGQLRAGSDAYVFCHSPDNLTAPWLCRELHQRVAESLAIPPLPWDELSSSDMRQEQLF
jgi:uncharacterized protein YecE (DUF72 family)